jgi:formyl-CoA transferase
LIENFKSGGLDSLDLGYERLRQLNPRLVHCSITGYGPDGPYAERPGYDFIAQGMGGIMSITGEPDGPPMKVGVAIADLTTGLFACISILAALHDRDRTGQGQHVDVSLLESVVSLLINYGSAYLLAGQVLQRYGNAHPNIVPYRLFKARDRWFIVAVGNDRQFYALCEAIGRPELARDERFRENPGRVAHRDLLERLLSEVFATADAEQWTQALLAVGVPSGPVNDIPDVFRDPQVQARQMLIEVEHPRLGTLKQAGFPFKFSRTPAEVQRHPPLLGEQTDEVLESLLGCSPADIARLRAEGAI